MSVHSTETTDLDPLGLSEIDSLEPAKGSMEKDWEAVSAALESGDRNRRNLVFGALASAASVLLVIALLTFSDPTPVSSGIDQPITTQTSSNGADELNDPNLAQPTTGQLIGLSQSMERQLQVIRSEVGSMPSQMVLYQVELQDLIVQVDDALSLSPDSRELWGQRVELQMDLMKLYRNQLRRDYRRLASV
ncbi:MAG TPA: hypothetical protein VJ984_08220 [Xanthomonadales bacterium]|nr:hypothetical protein [Xanthomonadales bacterium]